MFNVKEHTRQNHIIPLSSDFMATRYSTESGVYTFPSPDMWTIEKNIFFLLKNSVRKPFESQYIMRPDYLCIDEYGSGSDPQFAVLAPLIMRVNNVFSYEDFNLNDVIIPSLSSITTILQDKYKLKDSDSLEQVNW